MIDYNDIYEYDSSSYYYGYQSQSSITGYDAEGQITSAIEYVTMDADELPVIYQITGHNEKGNPLLRKNGKPMFRASYSILQDELFNYMTEQGFKGFQRGEYGSTAEHLTSLQYQIKQDKERLEKLQKRIQKEQVKYEPA